MNRTETIKFNSYKYNFHDLIGGILTKLEDLHFLAEGKYPDLFEVGKDSSTIFHQAFYDKYRSGWPEMQKMYEDFISEVVAPEYGGDFLFQKFPTFRVHLPKNIAVGRFHYDAEFGHPLGEVNYIIPLTDSAGTSTLWIESEHGKGDYQEVPLMIGGLVKFNGNQLTHGNYVNETAKTRVSMDFRILPLSLHAPVQVNESVTTKTKFIEGEYYKRFKK